MNDATETPAEAPRKKDSFWKSLLFLVVFAWVLRSLIIAPFSIPSGSMLPNMYIGDYLFVQKWPYGYSRYSFPLQIPSFSGRIFAKLPTRGDIVVFKLPGQENQDWVKRVIGLPGDRIAVVNGEVFLNGQALRRVPAGEGGVPISPNSPCKPLPLSRAALGKDGAVCMTQAFRETLPNGPTYLTLNGLDGSPGDDFAETTVPEGHLFMMGDNRDDSADSRFPPALGPTGGVGFLPLDHVVGRATVRFWSTDGSASWINPISWFTALRGERIGRSYNQ
jgi:signal peptidase I